MRKVFGLPEEQPRGEGSRSRRGSGWAHWRDRTVLPRALGATAANRLGVAEADGLRAALLRKLFLSGARGADSLRAAVDQLLAKTLKTPRVSMSEFRLAALRGWLAEGDAVAGIADPGRAATGTGDLAATGVSDPGYNKALPDDLPTFAALVRDTARRCETGRFGEDKIFIAHVWRALLAAGRAAPSEEAVFKDRLGRAHAAGSLTLSRADLTGAFDPSDVQASETRYLNATFHFLRLN